MNIKTIINYIVRLIAAFILLQTLYFKFGIGGTEALNESKEIFGAITQAAFGSADYEGYMRIGTGILELMAALMILINRTAFYGAILGVGLMIGAILSHVLFVGIVVRNDGGQLFIMSLVVLLCCLKIVFDNREKLLQLLKMQKI